MNGFSVPNFSSLMPGKISPGEIEKIVNELAIVPSDNLYAVDSEAVNIASLQVLIRRYSSLQEYVADMERYISDAVNRRAQLVCFPIYAGLLPASLCPQFDRYLETIQPLESGYPDAVQLHRMLSHCSDLAFDTFFHTMSLLAGRHRIYIMAGSTYYFDGAQLRHRAFLFSDTGELVGFQDKISVSLMEQEMGIVPAGEIRMFDTPVGQSSILIGSDVEYYETACIAKNLGARLLLCPTAFPGEYTSVTAALGLNLRVQETKLYGVQSALVGDSGLGFSLEGGCAIFAPNELLKQKNGVLVKAGGRFYPDIASATLNLDRLSRIQNPYTQDKNVEFMDKYADRLY